MRVRKQPSDVERERRRQQMEATRVNPNPRIVAFVDFALKQVMAQLTHDRSRYETWFQWASSWLDGEHAPGACVRVGRHYLSQRGSNPVAHCLGQLAWAGKEACYSASKSGCLVTRYIADAMIAFGVASPDKTLPLLMDSAQGNEARRAETPAEVPSSDESPVPGGDAPA